MTNAACCVFSRTMELPNRGFSGFAVLIQFHWCCSAKLKEEKHGQEWCVVFCFFSGEICSYSWKTILKPPDQRWSQEQRVQTNLQARIELKTSLNLVKEMAINIYNICILEGLPMTPI